MAGEPSNNTMDGEGKCWKHKRALPAIKYRMSRVGLRVWREVLGAPEYVLDWIGSGYKLPLRHLPDTFSMGNHNSALTHRKFVSDSITELLANRCIVKVAQKPYICSPLSVVANAEGKLRLVLNLKYLNQFLHKVKFKYEDIRVALLMFTKEDFLFKFDLKSGYHHLVIFEPHQKYLGFAWEMGDELNYFVFTVLPFGLATACYAFTKLMQSYYTYQCCGWQLSALFICSIKQSIFVCGTVNWPLSRSTLKPSHINRFEGTHWDLEPFTTKPTLARSL